jgi:hypothetical protein
MELKFRTSEQRRKEVNFTLREMIAFQKNDLEAIVNVASCFLLNESGEYMDRQKAQDILLDLHESEIYKIRDGMKGAIKDEAAPPTNGSDSDEPTLQEPLPPPGG